MTAVVFADVEATEVEAARVWGAFAGLAGARGVDLEIVAFTRVGRRARPHPPELPVTTLSLPPWPIDPVRAGAARLAGRALVGPRAAAPTLVLGWGSLGAAVAAASGRVLGVPSVGWGVSASALPSGLDEVWSTDDATAGALARVGVRAFRATLAPSHAVHGPAGLGPEQAKSELLLVGPTGAGRGAVVEGAARSGARVRLVRLGTEPGGRAGDVPSLPDDTLAERADALRSATAVLALEPEAAEGTLVEALLAARPVLVPADRRLAFLREGTGAFFDPTRAESVADAVVEVWSGLERGRIRPEALRAAGEAEALEVRAPAWAARLLELARAGGIR